MSPLWPLIAAAVGALVWMAPRLRDELRDLFTLPVGTCHELINVGCVCEQPLDGHVTHRCSCGFQWTGNRPAGVAL